MGKSKLARNNEKKSKKIQSNALQIAHPNSRKANRLAKQAIKQAARMKVKKDFSIKKNLFGEKLLWFQENLPEGATALTPQQFEEMFNKYLARFNDELEQIAIKHSIGNRKRQHASREDIIKMTLKRDNEEFDTCGIEMVDILSSKQLQMFKDWEGEVGKINNFVIKRFSRKNLKNFKSPQTKIEKQEEIVSTEETKVLKEIVNADVENMEMEIT